MSEAEKECRYSERGKKEMEREYKNRGKWRCSGEERWQRKKKEMFCSVFLNMSKAPILIRLSHGATGGICSL